MKGGGGRAALASEKVVLLVFTFKYTFNLCTYVLHQTGCGSLCTTSYRGALRGGVGGGKGGISPQEVFSI